MAIPRIQSLAASRWFLPSVWLIGAVIILALYGRSTGYPFVSDDLGYLENNPQLLDLTAAELWRLFVEPFNPPREFLPLRELSFWIDYRLFGLDPTGFRWHNLLLHSLCLPIVFLLTRRLVSALGGTGSPDHVALVVMVLFALHPTLVEPVVWISGRKYLLANLFALGALYCSLRALSSDRLHRGWLTMTVILIVAMMLSKTSYVPVTVLVSAVWCLHAWLRSGRIVWLQALLWSAMVSGIGIALLFTFIVFATGQESLGDGQPIGALSSIGLLGQLFSLATGLRSPQFYYWSLGSPEFGLFIAVGGASIVIGAVAVVRMLVRRPHPMALGCATFIVLSAPYVGLHPFEGPSLVQDRYLALAVWPLLVAGALLTARWGPRFFWSATMVVAAFWAYQSWSRTPDWQSLDRLISRSRDAAPGYFVPSFLLITNKLLPTGAYAEAQKIAAEISHLPTKEMTLALLYAESSILAFEAGDRSVPVSQVLWRFGERLKQLPPDAARDGTVRYIWGKAADQLKVQWDRCVRVTPEDSSLRYNAALWMLRAGYFADAEGHFAAVLGMSVLSPEHRGMAWRNLGLAQLALGKLSGATASFSAALAEPVPDKRAACGLAKVFRRTGDSRLASAETVCLSAGGLRAN